MLGTTEIMVIGGVVVLLFGARKLPQLGGAIGESIKNFKKGVKEPEDKQVTSGDDDSSSSKTQEG